MQVTYIFNIILKYGIKYCTNKYYFVVKKLRTTVNFLIVI